MAFAMANALYNENKDVTIGLYDIDEKRIGLFKRSFSTTLSFPSIEDLAESSDIIILAVKTPGD